MCEPDLCDPEDFQYSCCFLGAGKSCLMFNDSLWCDTDFLDVKNKKVWVDWFWLRNSVFQDSNCGTRKMRKNISFRKFSFFSAMKMWTKQTLKAEWQTYCYLEIMMRVSYIYQKILDEIKNICKYFITSAIFLAICYHNF